MTTPTPTQPPAIDLRPPERLVAAVPYLLGFRPTDSVVLVTHRGLHGDRVGVVLRADLPPPGRERDVVGVLLPSLVAEPAVGVTVLVVGGVPNPSEREIPTGQGGAREEIAGHLLAAPPAHQALITALAEACCRVGRPVHHALWVPEIRAGVAFDCFRHAGCGGVLPDPDSSVMAATLTGAGRVTFATRDEWARLLAPGDAGVLARRAALLDAVIDGLPPAGDTVGDEVRPKALLDPPASAVTRGRRTPPPPARRRRVEPSTGERAGGERHDMAASGDVDGASPDISRPETLPREMCRDVLAALARARGGDIDLTDDQVVRLALALSDERVRDACLRTALPPGGSDAVAAERLWLRLVRETPAPERAAPACLLAFSAYLRGEGTLAVVALDVALEADPGHTLADLLRRSIGLGIPREKLATIAAHDDVPILPPAPDGLPPPNPAPAGGTEVS
ncbi:protein of unknown function [Amycolatopsis arida]|uniref:DUF4192 domain-containing protein n=1 Tax=Amycolatopsis arida TaxID=587909 RepID=A0A1I5XM80_9PSEU|nr:DUF4192 domain-containing protein [Amycolatopsis arida]TDX97363.1 uncharacterized protein DUF4192 [Amycolatopsis arida]SFQ33071.1 protein of unknown function [Amycolatopsis arida]